jgi:hypothetical protein
VRNIYSQKNQCVKIIKGFKFSFQKKLAFNKERRNCTTKICKDFSKVYENNKVLLNESKLNHNNHVPLSEQRLNLHEIRTLLKEKKSPKHYYVKGLQSYYTQN